jgi:signal transduction histidine kinase
MIWHSLRFRLIAGGLVAILIALSISGSGLVFLFQRHVTRTIADDLNVVLKQVIAGIELDAQGRLTITNAPSDPRFAEPLSGLYWQIAASDGDLLRSRSLWDTELRLTPDAPAPGEAHQHEMTGPAGQRVLVVERVVLLTAADEPRPVRVVVAADLARVGRAAKAFSRDLTIALAILGLVLGCATVVQVVLGLHPLAVLRRGVVDVRSGRRRHLPVAAPFEVQPLVSELNSLIDEQEREIERSRGRAADLAHGLKTPLAALAGDVDRLRRDGQARIADDIQSVAEAMRRHVDREFARARLRGPARYRTGAETDLAPLVRSLFDTLARTDVGERIRFEARVSDGLRVPIERSDLAEVLGNLLENATRFARKRVRVDATPSGIVIEDDGPGIAPEARANAVARGSRLDERGGAGLGLAIAQDVLDAYGWQLLLDRSQALGGLSVTLRRKPESAAAA